MKINKLMIGGAAAIALSLSSVAALAGLHVCGNNLKTPIYLSCDGWQGGSLIFIPAGEGKNCLSVHSSTNIPWSDVNYLGQTVSCNLYYSLNYTPSSEVATLTATVNQPFDATEGQVSGSLVLPGQYGLTIAPNSVMSGSVAVTLTQLPSTKSPAKSPAGR